MGSVLLLFLIPVGGGIPAGVLLAKERAFSWPLTSLLYLVSDLILALCFEPLLKLVAGLGRRHEATRRFAEAWRRSMEKLTAPYGGAAGPFPLILISFGVDPMTGRTAAATAGHGFVSGWTLAITGDMLYFWVIMAATLKLNALIGDPNAAMALILLAMIVVPLLIPKIKNRFFSKNPAKA